jgi:hypothetical protein
MPKITDPDYLHRGVEIIFNTGSNASGSKTIELVLAGSCSYDGVTLQAVYSKCKELWDTTDDLVKFPIPIISITEKKFDLVNDWDFHNTLTKNLIRDAGWSLKNSSNASLEEYMGFITLGTLGASDQIYIQQTSSVTSWSDNTFTGSANNAIKIYGANQWGNFDYRNYFKCFTREYAKTYDQSQLSNIGETAVTYQVYSFPLQNSTDVKVSHADPTVNTGSAYTDITCSFYSTPFTRTIGAGTYPFTTLINGDGATKEQIYEKVQYLLRQNSDINSKSGSAGFLGTIIGKTATGMLTFVGDTLKTSPGVFVDNIANSDINYYEFYDTGSNKRVYPFVAAGTITFSDTLKNDSRGIYKLFFTSVPSGSFGSSSAIIVNDSNGAPITGSTSGSTSVSFTFDYDGNVQGGRTPQTDANVTVVAIGLSTAQYVSTAGTIARSNANAFSLVSTLERNYSNV